MLTEVLVPQALTKNHAIKDYYDPRTKTPFQSGVTRSKDTASPTHKHNILANKITRAIKKPGKSPNLRNIKCLGSLCEEFLSNFTNPSTAYCRH